MGTDVTDVGRAALAGDPSWKLVQRISASSNFQKSPRLQELLLYICERALLNRPDDLREQLIGCRVFLRRPDYNSGEDNIVRVEVRRLRKRLEDYFNSEGRDEPIVISIPKGSYVPVFQPRERAFAEAAPAASAIPETLPAPVAQPVPVPAAPAPSTRWYRLAMVAVIAVSLLGIGFWAGRRKAAAVAGGAATDWSPLWPVLFNRDQQTLIVCADSALVMAQALTKNPVSLDDYMKRQYTSGHDSLETDVKRIFGLLSGWIWTDLADVRLVDRFHRVNAGAWDRVSIRTARTTQIHDFTSGNAVILGSTQSNPWNTLFEQQLNFRIEWDERTRTAMVRNKSPLAGEQPIYKEAGSVVYSTISFVPNLRRNGSVLIVAGTNGQGTETAGEHITTAATYSRLMDMITSRNGGDLPYFEVLLKSGALEGIAKDAEVVAYRIISPEPKAK
jgi:hypothetical protein